MYIIFVTIIDDSYTIFTFKQKTLVENVYCNMFVLSIKKHTVVYLAVLHLNFLIDIIWG